MMNKFFYVLLIITITLSASIASAEKAEIILSKTIDVPDRTVSFENQVFDITDVGIYKINQDIRFTVNAPGVDDMLVILYDKDKLTPWFMRFSNTGGRVVSVIPANKTAEAGTYAITVWHERKIIGAIPVVISDYDLSVIPESKTAIAGRSLGVKVKISRDGIPVKLDNTVKVVLSKGSSSIEINATEKDTGVYEANIPIPIPMNGTYSLYSVITTERKVFMNYPEILGIESGGSIEILPPQAEKKTPFASGAIAALVVTGAAWLRRKRL